MKITDLDTNEEIYIFSSKIHQKRIKKKWKCQCGGSYTLRARHIHECTNRHSNWETRITLLSNDNAVNYSYSIKQKELLVL